MKKVNFTIQPMIPSKNIIPQVIRDQFEFRRVGITPQSNNVTIITLEEPIWWNRPAESNCLTKQESDGIYSLNLPYFGDTPDFKVNYNLLLNVGCIPVAIHLNLHDLENPLDKNKLQSLPMKIVRKTLIELGVPKEDLEIHRNDLLYHGKKFLGSEVIIRNDQCSIDFMITLFYKPEEPIFKRLTGKYALKRQITGIIEETNLFTKEQFIDAFMSNLKEFISKL